MQPQRQTGKNSGAQQYNRINLQYRRHPHHLSHFHKASGLLRIPMFSVFNRLGPLSVHTSLCITSLRVTPPLTQCLHSKILLFCTFLLFPGCQNRGPRILPQGLGGVISVLPYMVRYDQTKIHAVKDPLLASLITLQSMHLKSFSPVLDRQGPQITLATSWR